MPNRRGASCWACPDGVALEYILKAVIRSSPAATRKGTRALAPQEQSMKLRSRLKHVAAGLLGSFISRYNDVGGHWALGLLYSDVKEPPHYIEFDLLSDSPHPAGACASTVAARYAIFLRAALERQHLEWDALTMAVVTLQFNAKVADPTFHYPCLGDPVVATVRLESALGHVATVSSIARCYPYRPMLFRRSTRA